MNKNCRANDAVEAGPGGKEAARAAASQHFVIEVLRALEY